jgi:hypothetical protein
MKKNRQGKNYIYFRKKLDHVNSKQLVIKSYTCAKKLLLENKRNALSLPAMYQHPFPANRGGDYYLRP